MHKRRKNEMAYRKKSTGRYGSKSRTGGVRRKSGGRKTASRRGAGQTLRIVVEQVPAGTGAIPAATASAQPLGRGKARF